MRRYTTKVILWLFMLAGGLAPAGAANTGPVSQPISAVLREPLPAEELSLSTNADELIITGPTFVYRVQKASGAIHTLRVMSEGDEAIAMSSPADIRIDDHALAPGLTAGGMVPITVGKDKIVLQGQGILGDQSKAGLMVDCTLLHTFFNDGVVVSSIKLNPRQDLPVKKGIAFQLQAQGKFTHYLHKRQDEHGEDAVRGSLPEAGKAIHFSTLTSCLQVFSRSAMFAIFTDRGATYLSRTNLDTAAVEVASKDDNHARVSLSQYLVHVAPGDEPWVLKAGEEFSFRVGISVAPNRIAPRRQHDLRMFTWIGDARYPYPTDEEIEEAARAGYTIFPMHRLGNPGEPRPPAGELDRVIRKVHEMGMLFLWTENNDLMYEVAPGVQEMKAKGKLPLWQRLGEHYTASMDPYCDLESTCLASPNGLADYRLATINRMMERFDVDGMYLDDNLAYPCTRWLEHGHPRPVYDSLIELHEMNWRRRQLLLSKCPHEVLVSHNTKAIILLVLCDFDAILYGEGYSFGSLEHYRDYYWPAASIPAHCMIWPGGVDPSRCAASVAYNYDLLTGGGEYCYIDWRLFPKKFSYAAGLTDAEHVYVQTYNLAQYYFGLYESKPYYFADSTNLFITSTPLTYASIYRNRVWNDWLIPIANMDKAPRTTALEIRAPQDLGFEAQGHYEIFDTHQRTTKRLNGAELNEALSTITIPAQSLQLFCVRRVPSEGAFHLWGGKRLSEVWDSRQRKLTLTIQGPAGLQETLFVGCGDQGIEQVNVEGNRTPCFYDPSQGVVHGKVTFTSQPLKIEVLCASNAITSLPNEPVPADALEPLLGAR